MMRLRHALIAGAMLSSPAFADWKDAKQLAELACVMCHAAEMPAQQRLTRPQWDKTLAKMAKWGPELQEGEPEALAEFFAGPHSPAASPLPAATSTIAEVMARLAPEADLDRGNADAGAAAFAKDCAACHGTDARGKLAPSLIGRPVLARLTDFARTVHAGRRRMPSFEDRLAPETIRDIFVWVRKVSREADEPKLNP